MKKILALLALTFIGTNSFAEIRTVPHVDLSRYLGNWYEIARNPVVFEQNCFCSLQKLSSAEEGTIKVLNSCNQGSISGPLATISGTATSDDKASNSKLTVDFGLPYKGEYWIIALADDYSYAVVTDSKSYSMYILSKTPTLSDTLYNEALQAASAQVDTSKLEKTVQQGCRYP